MDETTPYTITTNPQLPLGARWGTPLHSTPIPFFPPTLGDNANEPQRTRSTRARQGIKIDSRKDIVANGSKVEEGITLKVKHKEKAKKQGVAAGAGTGSGSGSVKISAVSGSRHVLHFKVCELWLGRLGNGGKTQKRTGSQMRRQITRLYSIHGARQCTCKSIKIRSPLIENSTLDLWRLYGFYKWNYNLVALHLDEFLLKLNGYTLITTHFPHTAIIDMVFLAAFT